MCSARSVDSPAYRPTPYAPPTARCGISAPRRSWGYDRLSRYEPLDNGATIVYGSMYGNTEAMAEAAAEGLASGGVRNIAVHNASVSDMSYMLSDIFRHRGLIIAAPTYSASLFRRYAP